MHLIGFAGKRTSGKSTAARYLIETRGFHKAKFAASLKAGIRTAFGLTDDHTDGDMKEVPHVALCGHTPREVMEWFGEGARRRFGEDVWVKRWFDTVYDPLTPFVFDDVRNPTEAHAIQSRGGVIVLMRSDETDALPTLESEEGLHLIRPDYTIDNDKAGSLADLHDCIRAILCERARHHLEVVA